MIIAVWVGSIVAAVLGLLFGLTGIDGGNFNALMAAWIVLWFAVFGLAFMAVKK